MTRVCFLILVLFTTLIPGFSQKCNTLFTDINVFTPVVQGVTNCISSNNGSITFNYQLGHNPANLVYQISGKHRQSQIRTPFFPTQVAQQRVVLSSLQAGIYDSFFVQGPAGCIDTFFFPVTVNIPGNLFYTPIPFGVSGCVGSNTGRIEFLFTPTATNFNYQITATDINANTFGPFGHNNNKIVIANLPANVYTTFTIVGPGGCVDVINQNVIVSEPQNPLQIDTIIVFNATCSNNGALVIQASGGQGNYVINTTGGNPPQNYSGPSPDNLKGGIYNVSVTDGIGCVVQQNGIQLLQGDTFVVNIELDGGSNVINIGESVQGTVVLDPNSSGFNPSNFSYEWSNTYRISCIDCGSPVFNPCRDTTYFVVVRDDSAGCAATVNQKIEVVGAFNPFVPNAFTPNGTGPVQNEEIRVFGTGIDQVDMVVFDSRGAMVFKGKGNGDEVIWDGTMGGTLLNSGTYLYDARITSVCDEEDFRRGQILLIR